MKHTNKVNRKLPLKSGVKLNNHINLVIVLIYFLGLELDPKNEGLLQGETDVKNALMQQVLGNQQMPMDIDPTELPKSTPKPAETRPKPPTAAPKVEDDLPENKLAARSEKELGNAAYRKKDFETALSKCFLRTNSIVV